LILWFYGREKPLLEKVEFHCECSSQFGYLKQRAKQRDNSFTWTEVPQAISLLFLEYSCAGLEGRAEKFCFSGGKGSLAASLGYAIAKNTGKVFTLFTEYLPSGGEESRVFRVFDARNPDGKVGDERLIFIKSDYLPAENVQVFLDLEQLKTPKQLRDLSKRIRTAWSLEPSRQPESPVGEGASAKKANPAPPPAEKLPPAIVPPPAKPPEPVPAQKEPPKQALTLPPSILSPPPISVGSIADRFLAKFRIGLPQENAPRQEDKAKRPEPTPPAPPRAEPVSAPPQPPQPPVPPVRKIDPRLFEVPQTDDCWPDDSPLICLGDEDAPYTWTMKNAFEGVLILGATGSGKTSGSGAAIAESFLRSGFGGLVLTVKEDEAESWRRLCAYCGREDDFISVSRGGSWKLNILAYEAQHPGRGGGLSENLVAFCRNLLRISSRHQGAGGNEQFWEAASNHLLNATFDLFLLAGGEITFDRLASFVQNAPTERLPSNEGEWLKVPVFGSILTMAKQSATTDEDRRIFERATDYWFKVYPGLGSRTRTSVTLGVFSLLDAFRGRDIPDIISSDTNVTPESIMAGKIVVLDLPLNSLGHAGLVVQSAWKFLFQTALKRRERARSPHQRPVFLWEDEGQHFFSEHDHHFQATARSSRVSRVLLSQNVHNFYQQFGQGGREVANSVFGNLNTKIFHKNSDPETNEWASRMFGTETRMRTSFSHQPPQPAKDMWDSIRRMVDPPSTGGTSTAPNDEPAVRPEEFALLRNGGPENDFQVDAYITWLGLSAEGGRHFTNATFIQNQNL
jgi:hypothetical protein